jgi:Protein of unknown function (DUF2917)
MLVIPNQRLIKANAISIFIPTEYVNNFQEGTAMNTNCPDTINNSNFSMNLQHQAMFSVPDASKVRIGVAEGSVWITLDNDTKDYVLDACGVFTTTQPRRALVYALQPACVTVSVLPMQTSKAASNDRPTEDLNAITLYPRAVHSPC